MQSVASCYSWSLRLIRYQEYTGNRNAAYTVVRFLFYKYISCISSSPCWLWYARDIFSPPLSALTFLRRFNLRSATYPEMRPPRHVHLFGFAGQKALYCKANHAKQRHVSLRLRYDLKRLNFHRCRLPVSDAPSVLAVSCSASDDARMATISVAPQRSTTTKL